MSEKGFAEFYDLLDKPPPKGNNPLIL